MGSLPLGHAFSYSHSRDCDGEHLSGMLRPWYRASRARVEACAGPAYMASKSLESIVELLGERALTLVEPYIARQLSQLDVVALAQLPPDAVGAASGASVSSRGAAALSADVPLRMEWRLADGALNLLGHIAGRMKPEKDGGPSDDPSDEAVVSDRL